MVKLLQHKRAISIDLREENCIRWFADEVSGTKVRVFKPFVKLCYNLPFFITLYIITIL